MRWTVLVCLAGLGCAAGSEMRPRGKRNSAKIASLEARVAALEAPRSKPELPEPEPAPFTTGLEQRIEQLERELAELKAKLAAAPAVAGPGAPSAPRRFGPDPAKIYAVPLDDSPVLGRADAPVTMVAAVQFPEPYTHRAWPVLKDLRKQYGNELRIVFKSFVVHQKANTSSISACAAARQGGLDAMEDAIYTAAQHQLDGSTSGGLRELDEVELRDLARVLRLDLKQYDRDLAACKTGQQRDITMFKKLGQGAVPVFWINGRPLSGAQPIESFRTLIDEELAKAKQDRAAGGKAADYYDRITRNGATGP